MSEKMTADEDRAVLMQFAEFEEADGTPVEWCSGECGVITHNEEGWHSDAWYIGWYKSITPAMKGDRCAHCPKCGTLVGLDEDDRPYRVRLSRLVEALRWLALQLAPFDDDNERESGLAQEWAEDWIETARDVTEEVPT